MSGLKTSNKNNFFLNYKLHFVFLSTIIFTLYLYTSSNNYGYDDEFATINIIENLDFLSMVKWLQTNDIHPPLSYLIDKILFNIFRRWVLVRIFISSLLVSSIFYLAYKKYQFSTKSSLLLLFLGFDPGVLMWGTSIRWQSYFIIVICWFLVVPNVKSNWFYFKQIIGLTILCYTGYVGIILIPPLFLLYNA